MAALKPRENGLHTTMLKLLERFKLGIKGNSLCSGFALLRRGGGVGRGGVG